MFLLLRDDSYILQPQINLASIINKESNSRYQNELFRNIDFGIFDKNYKLIVLIEINDRSHLDPKRRERDDKVHRICKNANIPLITFWTSREVKETYIRDTLRAYVSVK